MQSKGKNIEFGTIKEEICIKVDIVTGISCTESYLINQKFGEIVACNDSKFETTCK